MMVQAAPIQLS